MKPVIKLKQVTKLYGSNIGTKNVSLEVMPGSIFGFLGPNGAGKTTTISMLVDLIRPTQGTIEIFGLDSVKDSLAIRQRIGFLAGDFSLDKQLTGRQQLTYLGNLRGGVSWQVIKDLADRLACDINRPIHTLSRGNKQKIGLISALMHQPELLIFDEPTSGLDPLIQAEFNKLIAEHKQNGKTAFISSHLLSEIQEICDQVAFIKQGEIIAMRQMTEIADGLPKLVHAHTTDNSFIKALSSFKGLSNVSSHDGVVDCTYHGDIDRLISLLSKHKIDDITIQEADLETVFMKYYEPVEASNV